MKREDTFEELYRRYYAGVSAYLIRLGFERSEAQELAQEVFVRVYRNFAEYREGTDWAYLRTVARNLAANEIRNRATQKRASAISPLDDVAGTLHDNGVQPDAALERKEDSERLAAAIDNLPPSLRSCVMLYLAGHGYEEMATILRISMSALKSRLHAARAALKMSIGSDTDQE